MLKNSSLTKKLYLGLGAVFTALLVLAALGAQSFSELSRANHRTIHTYSVLVETHGLGEALVNMDTGARGFAVFGEERFLRSYISGRTDFARYWDRAKELTGDNPAQQERLRTLQADYLRWADHYVRPLLETRKGDRLGPPSLEEIRRILTTGKPYMDSMRQTLAEINAAEGRLLEQRTAAFVARRNGTVGVLVVFGFFVVALTTGLSTMLVRNTKQLVGTNEALEAEVAERQQAQEALMKAKGEAELARDEAERSNRAKSEFLSRMSHELRTPLNSILGFAQVLEMDATSPTHLMSVEHILKGGRHLLDLINEILDLARIESGQLHLSIEPVCASTLVREVLELIRPLADQREVTVERQTAEECDTYIQADQQRFKQVLLNLLSNAVKYNREGGEVVISCAITRPDRLRIGIRDTGPGIPPEKRDHLFSPFVRLGAERTEVEGTGLGLALSKNLVEVMGGRIWAESTVGQGSTFWVEVPVAKGLQGQPHRAEEARHVPNGPGASSKILYIEDNLANLRLIEQLLARLPGVELVSAMQGSLGVELAREHRPDLILLDLNLPDLSGKQVLHRLREDARTRSIPVVILSADATPGQIKRLLAAGAREYLTKPLDVKQFYEVLNAFLEEGENPEEKEG